MTRKGYDFTDIRLDGDFAHCASHNFLFNPVEENKKLHDGLPCFYTDKRYKAGHLNSYQRTRLYWDRRGISLKSCIRRTLKCRNIPIGTTVTFAKYYYLDRIHCSNEVEFKIRRFNSFDPNYEISNPTFFNTFKSESNDLIQALRESGFLVEVRSPSAWWQHEEIAIAYGHGKRIGFSSGQNSFREYSLGCENILWDYCDNFDKWSRCNTIPKNTPIHQIISILT